VRKQCWARQVGIDLGMLTTRIIVKGEDMIASEPTAVAIRDGGMQAAVFGEAAFETAAEDPEFQLKRPTARTSVRARSTSLHWRSGALSAAAAPLAAPHLGRREAPMPSPCGPRRGSRRLARLVRTGHQTSTWRA